MRRYEVVFFDMGHTLVEFVLSEEDRVGLLRPLGLPGGAAELNASLGAAIADLHAAAGPEVTSGVDHAGYVALWTRIYREALRGAGFLGDEDRAVEALWEQWLHQSWRLYPEALDVLDRLAGAGVKVGIISNWPATLGVTCERLGVAARCPVVVCSAVVGWAKPDVRIFRAALDAVGVPAERALHVGDNYEADVIGARGARMDALLLQRSGTPVEPGGDGTDCVVVSSLTDVLAILGL